MHLNIWKYALVMVNNKRCSFLCLKSYYIVQCKCKPDLKKIMESSTRRNRPQTARNKLLMGLAKLSKTCPYIPKQQIVQRRIHCLILAFTSFRSLSSSLSFSVTKALVLESDFCREDFSTSNSFFKLESLCKPKQKTKQERSNQRTY